MDERIKRVGGMIEAVTTEVIRETSVTVPLCKPQIPL
jgi:hypothetical protein